MGFLTIWRMADNQSLTQRAVACAAVEGVADPLRWATERMILLAAQPGWAAAWESAVANGIADPGADEAVISDLQLTAAVQRLKGAGS